MLVPHHTFSTSLPHSLPPSLLSSSMENEEVLAERRPPTVYESDEDTNSSNEVKHFQLHFMTHAIALFPDPPHSAFVLYFTSDINLTSFLEMSLCAKVIEASAWEQGCILI